METEAVYLVPDGYFEALASTVLNKIRAKEELNEISPLLAGLSRKMEYAVPEGFFQNLSAQGVLIDDSSAREELSTLSPILNGIDRKMPYSVPEGYFDQDVSIPETETRVVSISSRSWFRYAAAAVITAVIVTTGFLTFNRNEIDPDVKPFAWVEKKLKKVSTDDINEFVDLVDANGTAITATSTPVEIDKLLNEVSTEDIQDFLDETEAGELGLGDDILN